MQQADGQPDERPRKRDPDAFGRESHRTYTAGSVGLLLSQFDHCVQGGALSTQKPRCIVGARDAALPDRIGAQMCRRVNAWALALVKGCQYSHSRLVGINHNATMQHLLYHDEAAAAERFFNLGNGCRMLSRARDERLIPIQQATARIPHQLRSYGLWLLALRERIGNVSTPHYSRAENKAIILAVHIRRGDLIANHFSTVGRFVPGSFYERALPMLVHAISNSTSKAPLHVHIYSDELMALSKPLVFWWPAEKQERWTNALRRAGASSVSFHLDGDALTTLGHLLEADVVLGSSSSFSSLAHLYSMGVLLRAGSMNDAKSTACGNPGGVIELPAPICTARMLDTRCAHAIFRGNTTAVNNRACKVELRGCSAVPTWPEPLGGRVLSALACKIHQLTEFKDLLRHSTKRERVQAASSHHHSDEARETLRLVNLSTHSPRARARAAAPGRSDQVQWLSVWNLIASVHAERLALMDMERKPVSGKLQYCPTHFARLAVRRWPQRKLMQP